MLEGVVTNLLNQYLGQFLEGLDADQLKISVWGGEVNLVDVKVKSGALDLLHLPITVKYGLVKKLHLSANWRKLSTKPVKVELSGVYIVAIPSSSAHIDSKLETANALASKLTRLQGAEDLIFGDTEEGDEEKKEGEDSYMGKLTTKILDNVEISLKDIHIRYEDFDGPHPPMSFGIGLQELKAETTDEHWKPTFIQQSAAKAFKMVTLNNVCAYMNVNDQVGAQVAIKAAAALKAAASAPIPPGQHHHAIATTSSFIQPLTVETILKDPNTAYLIRPVSGYLRMWLNKATQPPPRVWMDVQLYDISLQLTENQFGEMINMINRISESHTSMSELMKSFQDHFRQGTVQERRLYVDLYKRTLNALWLDPLTPAQVKQKEALEEQLKYEDLRSYRNAAIAELKRELGILGTTGLGGAASIPPIDMKLKKVDRARSSIMLREQAKKLTSTFFSKLGMSKPKEIKPERILNELEKEAIYATIEAEGVTKLEELPKDYVHVQLSFMLQSLGFSLFDPQNQTIAILKAEQTQVGLTVRETTISTIVTLGNIVMSDLYTPNTLYRDIIQNVEKLKSSTSAITSAAPPSLTPSSSSSNLISPLQRQPSAPPMPGSHVFQVEIHSPPMDGTCDLRIAVRAKAPRIVVHSVFVDRMLKFFTPKEHVDWRALQISMDDLANIEGLTAVHLAESLAAHLSIDLSVDLAAPTILVPRDPTILNSDILVIDLGRMKLSSRLQNKQAQADLCAKLKTMSKADQERLDENQRMLCYDIYNIGVKQVQIYLTTGTALANGPSPSSKTFLLNPFDVTGDFWQCMSSEVLSMPDIRLLAELPLLQFSLSNSKYTRLMLLMATFENMIALFTGDQPANVESIVDAETYYTGMVHSAQQLLLKTVVTNADEVKQELADKKSIAAAATPDQLLDLSALTKILRGRVEDAEALMHQIDADHNGTISRQEFETWISARKKAREQNELVEIVLQWKSIVLTLSNDPTQSSSSNAPTDVMELRIDRVAFKMNQHTFQMKLGFVIGSLSLADLVTPYKESRYLINTRQESEKAITPTSRSSSMPSNPAIISSAPSVSSSSSAVVPSQSKRPYKFTFIEDDEFINIQLLTTSDRSPGFASRPIDVDLRIGFSAVAIRLEPESVQRIGMYIMKVFILNDTVNSVLIPKQSSSPPSHSQALQASSKDKSATSSSSTPSPPPPTALHSKRASRISVNIATHFESVKLQLYSKNSPILESVMNRLHGEFQLFASGSLHIFTQLETIYVKDCTPAGSTYPFPITTSTRLSKDVSPSHATESDALVRFFYDTYHELESDYPGYNASIQASVHGLQFTFLQRFLWEIIYFATTGAMADFIDYLTAQGQIASKTLSSDPTTADLSSVTASMSQDYAALAVSQFIKLDFSLTNVDLIVPQHSSSDEYIRATIDKISMTNGLLNDPVDASQRYQQMILFASAFKVNSFIHEHGDELKPVVDLSPFTVVINLLSHQSRISIDVDVKSLVAVLAPAQWHWIFLLTQLNFGESAQVIQPSKRLRLRRRSSAGSASATPVATKLRGMNSPPPLTLTSPTSPPPRKQVPPTTLVFQLNASLHKLAFMLTENKFDANTEQGALASFRMTELYTGVSILANGSMDINSFCGSLSMTDLSASGSFLNGRPILPEYRELLLVVEDANASEVVATSTKSKPIMFKLNKTVDEKGVGWSVIDVSVANLRFNLGPVIFRLPTFFSMPPTPSSDLIAAPTSSLPSLTSSTSTAPAPITPSYMVLKLFLANPVIQFVRDPTADISEAILLTFGAQTEVLISNTSQRSVLSSDFHLTDLKCYTTHLDVSKIGFVQVSDDPSVSNVIIQPFSANGLIKLSTPTDVLNEETILDQLEDPTQPLSLPVLRANLIIDPISVQLSYQTYRLALRTLDSLSNATSLEEARQVAEETHTLKDAMSDMKRFAAASSSKKPPVPPNAPPEEKDAGSLRVDVSMPLEGGLASDLEEQTSTAPTKIIPLFRSEEVNIELKQLHLSLVNDATRIEIPIARFQVDHFNLKLHGFAHQRVFHGDLGCSAEYFNQSLVVWEPMIEHFILNLDLNTNHILSTAEFNRSLDPTANSTSQELTPTSTSTSSTASSSSSSTDLLSSVKMDIGDLTNSGAMLSSKLVVSSPGGLNLNITHTMFKGVQDCLNLFYIVEHEQKHPLTITDSLGIGSSYHHSSLLADGNRKYARAITAGSMIDITDAHSQFHQYRFDNFTELTIDFVRQAHGTLNTHASPKNHDPFDRSLLERQMTLDPYSTITFDFPEDIQLSEHELAVHCHKSGYGTIGFSALMRTSMAHVYHIPLNEDGSSSAPLIFEVFVQDGVKVCRLRSQIGLKNGTAYPMEIKTMGQNITNATFPILQPGDEYFCPLLPAHESGGFLISVRPQIGAAQKSSSSSSSDDNPYGWSSPVILLGDYSKQNQYLGCEQVVSKSSKPSIVTGDFHCSVYVHHLWERDGGDVEAASQYETQLARGKFLGQIYEIGPTLTIQNLLASEVDVRICEKTPGARDDVVHWTANIKRGDRSSVHTLLKVQPTYIQLRIASLMTLWSGLVALPIAPPEGHHSAHLKVSLFDSNKRELVVNVEVQMEGTMKLILYVPFEVYDLTHLGLILSCDKKQTIPLGALDEFKRRVGEDERTPIMFNFPTDFQGNKMDVCLTTLAGVESARNWSDVAWSTPISIDKIGLSITTTIPGPRVKLSPSDPEPTFRNLCDIGVSVSQAFGKYHRTKLIQLTPHFILINQLDCDLEFMQRVSNNPALVHSRSGPVPNFLLKAGETKEFHWLDALGNKSICFRRVGKTYRDWRWSGELDPTAIGDVSIMVRHKSDSNRCWFARAEIHVQNSTIFIQISEYAPNNLRALLPYRIQNHCIHQNIRVRQYIPQPGSSKGGVTTPVPPCDWLNLPSYSVLPFAPEIPIYSRPCQLEIQLGLSFREGTVVADRTYMVNLDEVKTHGRISVPPQIGDELNQTQTVYLYTESDESSATNVLKISNYNSSDSFAADLRNSSNDVSYKKILARQRQQRWTELLEMQRNLQMRLNLLKKRLDQEKSRVTVATKANTSYSRPTNLPPRDSAVVIEIKSGRNLPCRDTYIQVTFDGTMQKTRIVPGTNSPTYNHQFMFPTTNMQGSSVIRISLFEDKNVFVADKERGSIEFSLYDLDHEPKTSWLPLSGSGGSVQGELLCTIWHVPQSVAKVDESFQLIEANYREKQTILKSVENEMRTMQDRQMIDEQGRVLPVHLQNDVQFKLQLINIEGLDSALASMRSVGDVVCRVRSELTGKTASIFCCHYEPDHVYNAPPRVAPATSRGGASSSLSSRTPVDTTPRSPPMKLDWLQEVTIHVPEEMLSRRNEVVHLTFFFHPQDIASDDNESIAAPATNKQILNAGFLRATKLRANCPPIPLAHVSLPLNSVPVAGSREELESRVGTKTQRERNLIDWRSNRIPLQVDLYQYEPLIWCTISVIRMPAKSEENRSQFCVKLNLPSLTLSLIDAEPREVLLFSITGTNFSFDDTLCTQDLELKVERIQLDNQYVGAVFPIVIGFSPVEKEEMQPMVQLSVAKRKTRTSGIQLYEYASLLIQQLDVKVEEELIYTIIRFINTFKTDDPDLPDEIDTNYTKKISESFKVDQGSRGETLLIFEFLQIQPIALNISFEASPGLRARMSRMRYNPMEMVLSVAGTAMGSIQSAPVRLNGRTFEHVRGSVPVILGSLLHYYKGELISESYKVVGSFEFLGNPTALVNNLGTGVVDFFYLPSKGAIESPEKFGIGLAKGSLSLVKGVTSGIFNTVGSITGSVSKGLAIASLDDRFIEKSASRQQAAPKNVADGMYQGSKSLVGGIFKGITGIVTDPIKGAKKDGVEGFFKGVGKGLLGVVAKPTSGVVGFASQTLTGIGNTADYLTDSKVHPSKVRPQRFISPVSGLQSFNLTEAQKWEMEQKALVKLKKKGKVPQNATSASATKK